MTRPTGPKNKATKPKAKPKAKPRAKAQVAKAASKPARKSAPSSKIKVTYPKGKRSWLRSVLRWGIAAGIWLGIGLGIYLIFCAYSLPDLDEVAAKPRRPAVVVEAANGRMLASYGDLHGGYTRYSDLSPYLVEALLATEDRGFFHHFGVSPTSIARAMVVNIKAGHLRQGGSTITQQLAKNLFLTKDRTLHRKVQELLLSFWLEAKFTKTQILGLYFSRVYFGGGTYGIEAAAQKFYGRTARTVNLYQAAVLVGALKAPSRYNPLASPKASHARAMRVLKNMVAVGYLEKSKLSHVHRSIPVSAQRGAQVRFFSDWVLDMVGDRMGPPSKDVWVRSTLDFPAQQIAEDTLLAVLDEKGRAHHIGNGAVVVMDHSGAVRAMVGGRTYVAGGFNRATQAVRQPGSTIKPFVYLSAFANGMSPETVMNDEPVTIGKWSPHNWNHRFQGPVTLRKALTYSLNTIPVKIWQRVGAKTVAATTARFGLPLGANPGPSVVLGSKGTTLLDLTAAYAGLANGGIGVWPHGLESVRDRHDRILDRPQGGGPGRIAQADNVSDVVDILGDVVAIGTGKRARTGFPVAGKTGTTQNGRDAWFVGFSDRYVVGVWLGNDDNSPMIKVGGSNLPAEIWRDIMIDLHAQF